MGQAERSKTQGRCQNQRAVRQSKSTRGKKKKKTESKAKQISWKLEKQDESTKENPQTESRQAGVKNRN